jgi:hypothetical protein
MAGYTGDSKSGLGNLADIAAQAGSEGADLAYKNKVAKLDAWVQYLDLQERSAARKSGGQAKEKPDWRPALAKTDNPIDFSKTTDALPQTKDAIQKYMNFKAAYNDPDVERDIAKYGETITRLYATKDGRKAINFKDFNNDTNLSKMTNYINSQWENQYDANGQANPRFHDDNYWTGNMAAIYRTREFLTALGDSEKDPLKTSTGGFFSSVPVFGVAIEPYKDKKEMLTDIRYFNSHYKDKETKPFLEKFAAFVENIPDSKAGPLPGGDKYAFDVGDVDIAKFKAMEKQGKVKLSQGTTGTPQINEGGKWRTATKYDMVKLLLLPPTVLPSKDIYIGGIGGVKLRDDEIADFQKTFPQYIFGGDTAPADTKGLDGSKAYNKGLNAIYVPDAYNPTTEDTNKIKTWIQQKMQNTGKQLMDYENENNKQQQGIDTSKDQGFLRRPITVAMAPTVMQPVETEKDIYRDALQGLLNQG